MTCRFGLLACGLAICGLALAPAASEAPAAAQSSGENGTASEDTARVDSLLQLEFLVHEITPASSFLGPVRIADYEGRPLLCFYRGTDVVLAHYSEYDESPRKSWWLTTIVEDAGTHTTTRSLDLGVHEGRIMVAFQDDAGSGTLLKCAMATVEDPYRPEHFAVSIVDSFGMAGCTSASIPRSGAAR